MQFRRGIIVHDFHPIKKADETEIIAKVSLQSRSDELYDERKRQ